MTTEVGHAPGRVYRSQDGNTHLNGSNLYDAAENAIAQQLTLTPASGTANVCNVTIQVVDGAGTPIAAVFTLEWWLSDASTGAGLTATTASGTVGAGSAGVDTFGKVSKKAGEALTDATGKYVLSITDTAKTGFFVAGVCPGTGVSWVGSQLIAANYG